MSETFKFRFGKFNCIAIKDGTHTYENPALTLFRDAPESKLEYHLKKYNIEMHSWKKWKSDYSCLLVEFNSQIILIDTGAGQDLPECGKLFDNLLSVGIKPSDIDVAVLSHAHPDHIGGARFLPNTRILMHRKEWNFWNSKPDLPRLPEDFKNLLINMTTSALAKLENNIELIDSSIEIVPGIKVIETPGHTPGHIAVSITSEENEILYVGDAILHPLHFEYPNWNAMVDVFPMQAEKSRRLLMSRAAKHNSFFFGFHFKFPSLCKVSEAGLRFHSSQQRII